MDNYTPNADLDKKEQDTRRVLVIIIISILLGVNGLLLWQFFDKKTHLEEVTKALDNSVSEKDALSSELQRVKQEYEKLNQENAALQSQMQTKDEEIKSKIAQIQKLINSGDAAQLRKAKEELSILKQMNQNYVAQLDSVKKENTELSNQNLTLNNNLNLEKGRVSELTNQNSILSNKVAMAAVLKTGNLSCIGVRIKSNGKEVETNKSASVQKIKTCFTVLENLVTEKGTKDVYLRVLSPDGAVMSTSSETFIFNGQPSMYSSKESFDYYNKDVNVCLYWEKGSTFNKGQYIVELYCEGSMIGNTSITFK